MTTRVTVEFVGGPELQAGLQSLTDLREIDAAVGIADRTMALAIGSLVPYGQGSLGQTLESTVTDRQVDMGYRSPYARWFHVPYLSEGSVQYAKKTSSRGRSYGQRIPNNPWMILAMRTKDAELGGIFITAVGQMIDRALAWVPRGF